MPQHYNIMIYDIDSNTLEDRDRVWVVLVMLPVTGVASSRARQYGEHIRDVEHLDLQLEAGADSPDSPGSDLLPILGLLGPLVVVAAGPVEEYGQSVAGLAGEGVTYWQVRAYEFVHADDEEVVGGVGGTAVHSGVGVLAAVEEGSGEKAVEPLLVNGGQLSEE